MDPAVETVLQNDSALVDGSSEPYQLAVRYPHRPLAAIDIPPTIVLGQTAQRARVVIDSNDLHSMAVSYPPLETLSCKDGCVWQSHDSTAPVAWDPPLYSLGVAPGGLHYSKFHPNLDWNGFTSAAMCRKR